MLVAIESLSLYCKPVNVHQSSLSFITLFYSWLVPLHNACAYGHLIVAELLVKVNFRYLLTFVKITY